MDTNKIFYKRCFPANLPCYAKIEIGIARGKKLYDKREVLKKREQEKKIQQKKFTYNL